MNERLTGIFNFVQAAEAGSFALAAQRMGLSRSAVGKSIARLEDQLGVRLFHRTTRSQSLTDDGQLFYERCARALAELESAEAALDSGRRAPSGRLRISVPALLGRHCVAPILLDVARQYPALELEVSLSDRRVNLVEEGFDLAVRGGPLADTTELMSRRLGAQIMAVCAAPSYLAERGRPQALSDLAHHERIMFGRDSRIAPWWFLDAEGRTLQVPITSRITFDDMEAIADAAVAGAGLALLPYWLVKERVRSGALTRVLEGATHGGCDIFAVWPQTRHLASKVRVVIDALVAGVPGLLTAAPQ